MLLEICQITKRFGGVTALNDVSFNVEKGSIFGLIGPNGAGKTTLFNVIAGVFRPTSGKVLINGVNIEMMPNHRRIEYGVARTFQNIRLFRNLTVKQNVLLGMHKQLHKGLMSALLNTPSWQNEEKSAEKIAIDYLEAFGLGEKRETLAKLLPYGEQKILEVIRALVTESQILLLDEPAAGLNPVESDRLVTFIQKIRNDWGRTVLLVEHDMNVVMGVCEQIVVLDHGEKIAIGKPEEIRQNRQVITAYLGRQYADGITN